MRIIIDSNRDIEELYDEVSKCVEDFVCLYRRLGYTGLVVSVQVEE